MSRARIRAAPREYKTREAFKGDLEFDKSANRVGRARKARRRNGRLPTRALPFRSLRESRREARAKALTFRTSPSAGNRCCGRPGHAHFPPEVHALAGVNGAQRAKGCFPHRARFFGELSCDRQNLICQTAWNLSDACKILSCLSQTPKSAQAPALDTHNRIQREGVHRRGDGLNP